MASCNDAKHKALRKALLPLAYGKVCEFCGELMLRGQNLDLDHVTPRVLGGVDGPTRMAHSRCNRRAGARLGNAIRWGRQKAYKTRW